MKKLLPLVAASLAIATPAMAQAQDPTSDETTATTTTVAVSEGEMLFDADGRRLSAVYAVAGDGSAQLLMRGKLVTIPVSTLSQADGKLTTSLTRADVARMR